ncbi:response regulator transcription factor [Oryzomicrobium sp.]|uniref:response regulator transcription factor n=1 Tax=Oryzomicrobium sp. TaxID=1911578 RepID=UPI002FE2DBF9
MSEQPATVRVVIVDDHPLVRDGVRACLEASPHLRVVGEAGDAVAAEQLILAERPDLALVDIGMRGESGIDLIARLRRQEVPTRLVVLTMYDNPEYVAEAMRAGARGYVLKDAPSDEIFAAIDAVQAGGCYYSAGVDPVAGSGHPAGPLLTHREKEVLALIAEGLNNKRIASALGMSVRTVETHRLNIKRKVGIEGTAALLKYAFGREWAR